VKGSICSELQFNFLQSSEEEENLKNEFERNQDEKWY